MNLYISDGNVVRNFEYIRHITGVQADNFIAVLKDNAYGHGIKHMVSLLNKEGVHFFAVASLDDAMLVRKVDESARVMILKRISDAHLGYAVSNGFDLMVGDEQYLRKIIELSRCTAVRPRIHIKINERINRWGFSPCEKDINAIRKICGEEVTLEGIGIHFKATYNYDSSSDRNLEYIDNVKAMFKKNGLYARKWHFRTTSDINRGIGKNEIVRIGAGIYGIPNKRNGLLKGFIPAMRGESYIYSTRKVNAGETIGYKGGEYVVEEAMTVGLISDGYAQGIRDDSSIYILGEKSEILVVFLDITIVRIDSLDLVGQRVDIRICDGGKRSLAEMTCDYGNCVLNKVEYE